MSAIEYAQCSAHGASVRTTKHGAKLTAIPAAQWTTIIAAIHGSIWSTLFESIDAALEQTKLSAQWTADCSAERSTEHATVV